MFRHLVEMSPANRVALPLNSRPLVRYRQERFGYLAAFPAGQVMMLDNRARPLLDRGASPEECRPYALRNLEVPVDFHFSAPLMGWVELTRRCNLRCPHCFVEGGSARSSELETGRIIHLLNEWAEMGVFSVVITGGEPTLHPDFVAIVDHAWRLGFVVSIATNGMPLTDRLLARIPRQDVIISMSLDGIHGQGGPSGATDFEFVTRKLKQLRQNGYDASIMTTTHRGNADQLKMIIEWAVENDVSLRSVPFVPMGRGASHPDLLNNAADVERAAQFWLMEEQWERVKDPTLGLCAGKVFNFLLTMVFATRRCMSGRGLCYVTSAGDVYPCSTCSGAKVLAGGSLHMNEFREIWEDPDWPIRQITWHTFRHACADCPVNADKYFCTGRCPGSSAVLNSTLHDCGTTEFQRLSIFRREEMFRQHIRAEPKVFVRSLPIIQAAAAD